MEHDKLIFKMCMEKQRTKPRRYFLKEIGKGEEKQELFL